VTNSFPRLDDILVKHPVDHQLDVAIIHNDISYMYLDLIEGMQRIGAALEGFGRSGEKVIVHLGNRPETVMAMFAISYVGGTFIPIPANIKSSRLHEIIEDSGATVAIIDDSKFDVFDELPNISSMEILIDVDRIETGETTFQKPSGYPAALMYTSGTTGKPKGVICPHHKMMNATDAINEYLIHTRHDVVASALPLNHGYGLYQVLTVLAEGGTVLLENGFTYPSETLRRIVRYGATGFAIVPSMITMFTQLVDTWADQLTDLEYITTAGAALPPSVFAMLEKELPNTNIIPMYGQTECVRALCYLPSDQSKNMDHFSVGKAIPGTVAYITSNDNQYEEGELIVESDHVMDGYWNNPEETAKTFDGNILRTGDVFRKINGLFYYIGRLDDVVKIKGERCSPQELDNALIEMPGIVDAASFAIPDKIWGNRFVAYVAVVDAEMSKMQVMRYCRDSLESHMMPKEVFLVGRIPKTANGKVSRSLLKDQYLEDK